MERIRFIPQIKSNYHGYDYLCSLYNRLLLLKKEVIVFDFSGVIFIEANLCAFLGAIFEKLEDNGNRISLENMAPKLLEIFRRNTFLAQYGYTALLDKNNTSLKYRKLNPEEGQIFYEYIAKELFLKPDFPSISDGLGNKIAKNIFELYENARTHGKCHYIHICGQFFPKATEKPLHFTIVDKGITIKENVSLFLQKEISGSEAIGWAMTKGHSTKKESGGLGLGIIFDFIKLNKGKIHIVSGNGYYEFSDNQIFRKELSYFFEGTLVNLCFNLNDKNYYFLKEESFENIF